jgi:hypothetical protein
MLRFTYLDKNIVNDPEETRYIERIDFSLVRDLLNKLRYSYTWMMLRQTEFT